MLDPTDRPDDLQFVEEGPVAELPKPRDAKYRVRNKGAQKERSRRRRRQRELLATANRLIRDFEEKRISRRRFLKEMKSVLAKMAADLKPPFEAVVAEVVL